jgi:hypothetical protein
MANAEEHPALASGHNDVPGLTLVLPDYLHSCRTLQGLVGSIEQARAGLADRVRRFRQLEASYAASGDLVRQALCRGQVLGTGHAAAALDEEIIQAFDLWQQYDVQIPGPGSGGDGPAANPGPRGTGMTR